MILSILIATLPERAHHLARIMSLLGTLPEGVEIVSDDTGRHLPTGTKRNNMITKAQGEWVCQVDDDDWVSSDYISSILEALKSNPDCVTFKGIMTTNGGGRVEWCIKLGEKYEARTDPDGVTRYYRWPNHLAVIRRSIAQSVKFPDIWHGEDYKWSEQIKNMKLLKSEVHIDKHLYHYIFITNK